MPKRMPNEKEDRKVKPIPTPADIDRIRENLRGRTRDLLLFDLALETGVPAKRLLGLRVKDLDGLNAGGAPAFLAELGERDGAPVPVERSRETFGRYMAERSPGPSEFLFKSRKGDGPLSISSASRLVSGWFEKAGLTGLSGLLSIRKTWEVARPRPAEPAKGEGGAGREGAAYAVGAIKAPTTQELVYRELKDAIVKARIKPGEKLVTEELARQMGTSRIPVREAIGRLAAGNFVTVMPKRGIVVNALSEKNLEEILQIRLMLELPAASLAAGRCSPEALRLLVDLNERYRDAQKRNEAEELITINASFHFTIYGEAGMPILYGMIRDLWNQVSPYYYLMYRQTLLNDPQTGHDYHARIIRGMERRDPAEVQRWLRIDLVESVEFVVGVMRSMKSEGEPS